MPSLVSMPPNIITAAFDTTSAGPSVAVAAARTPSCRGRSSRRRAGRGHPPPRAPRADLAARRDPVDGRHDLVVPAEDHAGSDVEQLERARDDIDRQRSGEVAADLGRAGGSQGRRRDAGPPPRPGRRSGSGPRARGRPEANGSRWRRCSSPSSESMLGPTTWAVENRGSSTVKRAASRMTSMHRSRRVTSQPSRRDPRRRVRSRGGAPARRRARCRASRASAPRRASSAPRRLIPASMLAGVDRRQRLGSPIGTVGRDDVAGVRAWPLAMMHRASTSPASARRHRSRPQPARRPRHARLRVGERAAAATATGRTTGSSARRSRSSATARRRGSMSVRRSSRRDDPDKVFYATNEHVFNEKGYGRGAVDRITTFYHQALAAHQAGDDQAASIAFGWMAHYYGDILQPYHTNYAAIDLDASHSRYEMLVDALTRTPTLSPDWSTPNRTPARRGRRARDGHRRGRLLARVLPRAVPRVPSQRDPAEHRVTAITRALLRRASSDLANLLASIDTGVGDHPRRDGQRQGPLPLHREEHDPERLRHRQGRGRQAATGRPCRHRVPEAVGWDDAHPPLHDGGRQGHRLGQRRRRARTASDATSRSRSRRARSP